MAEGNGKARPKRLSEGELALSETVQLFYTPHPAEGTTREDLMEPVFWSHVAKSIRSAAEIRVIPKDGAWYGRYLVIFADNLNVRLKELEYHVLDEVPANLTESDKYIVKWAGPIARFRVQRKADNA